MHIVGNHGESLLHFLRIPKIAASLVRFSIKPQPQAPNPTHREDGHKHSFDTTAKRSGTLRRGDPTGTYSSLDLLSSYDQILALSQSITSITAAFIDDIISGCDVSNLMTTGLMIGRTGMM